MGLAIYYELGIRNNRYVNYSVAVGLQERQPLRDSWRDIVHMCTDHYGLFVIHNRCIVLTPNP